MYISLKVRLELMLIKVAWAFILLSVVDGLITYYATTSRGCVELNPFMAPIASSWYFPFFKLFWAAMITGAVVTIGHRYRKTFLRKAATITLGFSSLQMVVVFGLNVMALAGLR